MRSSPAVALLLVLGCAGPEPGTQPLPTGSFDRYASQVTAHVSERCASAGCHGRPERPLALYAPGAYRADPARTHLDEPLTRPELEENMRRLSAFALDGPARSSLAIGNPWRSRRAGCGTAAATSSPT